jgi:hypothetical protein
MEAIVWGDDNAGGTTQVQTEVCGDFTHVFNRIWMVRKIANSNLLMLVGAQDNIGTQLDKDSDIPSRNLMAFLKKGYDVTMMVADDPDKLRPLHVNYGGFTAVPMTFMDGEQQCTHVFTDEITYLTFGYKANQTGCVSDVQFDGVKTFPWTQWTRQNYGANLNSGVSKGSYWLSDGIEVVSTTVKYDNGVNAPANYPSVTNSPTANALYIQRRRGAKNSKVTVTIEFNEPVRAEFSIYDIDGYARQHEGVTVTGECPSGGVIPQLSYAGSPISSIYTIVGNTATSRTSTWVSPTSRNAQVNVSFSTGVTKVIIEYFVTTDGNQAVSSVVRNLMISPIRIRQIPPPPTTNEDHLYFEKEVKNDELISTCEIPEYEFVIGNENCANKIVNLRDTLPAGLIWESVSIGSGTVSGLTTRYLSIDNITVPGSGELIFRATASFDIVAAGGAGSFPKQFDNRGWILYQRQTQSGNEDVKLPSEERTTHAPYASFTAYYEVKKQPVTSSITAVNPAKYVSDGEIEFTITANNPNPPISNVYIDVAYNANFVYGGFFQPSTLSAVLVGTPDSSLTVAGNVDGSVGFLLPTGTSTYKFRLKAPADADLVPDPDEIGKILDLAIQYVFSDGNGNPCEMVDTEGDATVPFSALKTFDDLATTTVNTQVTIPVLDNDEIPSDCLPVAPVPVTSLYTHHGTHILCNTDKICYTPDNGYAGIDSADYSVSCPPNTDTSRIYFVVLDGYTLYNVCSGKDVTMSFGAITDVELYWYSVQTGGTANPLTPTNSKALTGVTTGQTWWVEPHWKGKIFPRQQVQINIINTPTLGAISSNPSPLWICDNEQLTASHLNMPTINWNGATGSGSWQLETGVGTGTYTDITLPTNITYADNGKSIRYHASNTCGETSSIPIMLNVRPPLANDITVSADQSVCGVIPNPLTSSLPSGGNGVYTYQWEYSTNSGGTWTNISGATSATYTFSSPPASTIWYRLKVTSCNSTVTSTNYVVITVSSGFDAGAITVSDPNPICYNAEMPSMELSTLPVVSTGTYSVIWQEKTSSGGTWNDIIGTAGFTSYPYGYSSLTATRWYRVLVTNHGVSGNCTQQATNEIEITVYPVPTVNPVSSQTVCNGSATTAINFTTTIVPPPTVTYSWTNSDPSIGLGASGTGNIASFTATNSTTAPKTATITVTPKIGTCEGTQETFTITVLPTPTVDVIANQRVCRDDLTAAVNFTTTISGVTVDYEWMHTNAAVGLNTTSGSGTFPSFTATNTTSAPISTTVTVTPKISSGGATCTGAQKTFTITVNPKPAISTTFTRIICNNNGTFTVSPANGTDGIVPTGTKYSWNAPSHSDITGMTGGTDANSISGGPLTNTSTSAQVVTYNVTPSVEFGGLTCTGAQFTVDVTVYAPVTAGTIQSDQTICSGGTLSPLTTATPPGGGNGSYSYFWEYDNGSNGSSWTSAPGTNNTASYQPGVLAGVYKYRRQVTGCGVTVTSSNVVTVTVSSGINPGTITPLVPAHICHNTAAPTLSLSPTPSGGVGTLTYRWQYSTASDSGPWADVPNTDNSSYSPGTLTATTWYRVLVTDPAVTGACSEAATNVVQVLVIPFQSITNKTVDICSGNILHITPQDGVDGDVVPPLTFLNYYKWTVSPASNPSVVSGQSDVSMHGVVGGDQTLINHTSSVQTVTYYVTPVTTMGGTECEGAQFTVTVKVNPKPSAGNINMRICSGDTFDATPTDGGGNIVPASNVYYRWNAVYTSGTLSGVSSEVVGQTAISQTPVNLTSSVQTVVYTAYPIYDANNNGNTFDNEDCYGSAFTVTVDVNPVPAINNITMEICSGSIFTAGPSDVSDGTVPAGTKYTWTVIPASGAIISGQSDQTVPQNSISDGPLTNHTALQQTVTYNVTPIFTDGGKTCAGNIFTVAVTVTDLPTAGTLSYNSGTEICKSSGTVLPTWMPNPPTGGGTSSYTVTYADPPASTLTIDPITGNITPGTSDTGTYIVEYEMSAANSCNGFTRTATVKIADVPAVSNIVFTLVPLCDGASLTSTLLNPTPTVTPNNAVTTEGWEIETAAGSGSYVVLNLPHTVSYADNGKKIRYTATNVCGSTSSANTVTLTVMPIPKYSDIRLQVCSQPVPRSIYLSSYLDTLNVTAISWSAVAGPALESATVNTTGELRITAGFPLGISTYKCHVTHKCTTADVLVYVKNLANPVISPSLKDTVVVCQYLSEASHLQMNQIMGLEANGTWNYNTADLGAYITHVLAPSQYAGAYVFDAAAAWSALNGNASYNITYNGDTQATRFVFTYTTPSQSCFGSKTRELVIIVTSKLLP